MTGLTSHTVAEPLPAGDVITADYGMPGQAAYRRVSVNLSAGTITFLRCHTPSRFLATGPDAESSCRLDELRETCAAWVRPRDVGPVLEVVTPTGRARLPHSMNGFDAVREVIEEAVAKSGRRLRWYEAAAVQEAFVLACGAIFSAGVIWVLPEMSPGVLAATIWTMVILLIALSVLYWRSKRTWW